MHKAMWMSRKSNVPIWSLECGKKLSEEVRGVITTAR